MNPLVVDLSHHNTVTDFGRVYAAGIHGVIHKATQGASYVDPTYASRRAPAQAAGLLWGAYHFGTSDDVTAQVDRFLSVVDATPGVLLALDYEDEPHGRTMSLAQAKQWLQLVYERTGQWPVLYSGNRLKEDAPRGDAVLSNCRLWLAQYGPRAVLPAGFSNYWLWQYSESGTLPGVTGGVDLNTYAGTPDDLAAEWTGTLQTQETPAMADDTTVAATADAAVAVASDTVRAAQSALATLGYAPGPADGIAGPRTTAAVQAYQSATGLPATGALDAATVASLTAAASAAAVHAASSVSNAVSSIANVVADLLAKLAPGLVKTAASWGTIVNTVTLMLPAILPALGVSASVQTVVLGIANAVAAFIARLTGTQPAALLA